LDRGGQCQAMPARRVLAAAPIVDWAWITAAYYRVSGRNRSSHTSDGMRRICAISHQDREEEQPRPRTMV